MSYHFGSSSVSLGKCRIVKKEKKLFQEFTSKKKIMTQKQDRLQHLNFKYSQLVYYSVSLISLTRVDRMGQDGKQYILVDMIVTAQ